MNIFPTPDGDATIRILKATNSRPAFAFVGGPGGAYLIDHLGDFGRFRHPESTTKAIYISSANRPRQQIISSHNPLNTSLWGKSLTERLGLPSPVVVAPEEPSETKMAKLDWGSTIRHEYIHAKGGAEYKAFKGQDDYRRKVGLAPLFAGDEQLFSFLVEHYPHDNVVEARNEQEKIRDTQTNDQDSRLRK